MRPSTIWYILKQGFKNIKRNWMFSLASILTMSACIFLFGLFYSVVNNVNYLTRRAEEKVPITVFFNEGTTEEQISEVSRMIGVRPEVASIKYKSAEDAWAEFSEQYLGGNEKAAEVFRDVNPLEDAGNLQISVNDIETQQALVSYVQGLPNVREVHQSEQARETLKSVNHIVYYVSAAIIIILLAISVFLISNTVSVGISVRKEEIGIMKYIGATDRFVRAPFVLEGIILGLIGAAIPLAALYFIYNQTIRFILTRYSSLSGSLRFLSVEKIYRTLGPVALALGIGIGLIGSFWTTRKHLRV